MSKTESDTHLRYGQGIIIKGYKPEVKDDRPQQGYMTVRGFADVKANYETVEDILYFKNYRNCIFELLPAGNFEINDELEKFKSNLVDTTSQAEEEERQKTLQTLTLRAQSEKEQFELTIKRNKKSTIKFGDYVMLGHIDSLTFLSGTIRPSEGTNGAFSVEVSNKLSKAAVFQLLPYRSFEAESMEIPFKSPVLIKNVLNNGYLTFQAVGISLNDSNEGQIIEKQQTKSDESYCIPVKTATKGSKVYEVVTHFADLSAEKQTSPMPWQFTLHFRDKENDSLIQHDIVFLRHSANNGILSAVGEEIVLKQSKVQTEESLPFYESLWEIETYEEPRSYILRHLMSGQTLGVKRKQNGEPESAVLIDISDGPNNENSKIGSVELKMAKKDGGEINSESYIYICEKQYTLDVATQEEGEQQGVTFEKSGISFKEQLVNKKKMKRLSTNELQYEVVKLKFSSDISNNCFVIQQIEDDLKTELLFALSFHSTIINLREDLKWGATVAMKKVTYIRMMKVTEKIKQIIDFLKNCDTNTSEEDKQFQPPIPKRQNICKDLGLSQLLFELLFYIRENMNEEIFKDKINEKQKFYEMHTTIYKVLISLIKDNKSFKIHVSKWITFILEDFVQKGEEIHCEALMELLKDNCFFVENFVTPQLIDHILQNMLKEKTNKTFTQRRYIEVLRAFCIVDNKVFSHNQSLILKNFIERLESEEGGSCLQIKFMIQDEEIYCKVALDKKTIQTLSFVQFKQKCFEGEQNNSWQYYTAYMNLLADITKGRNKSVEKYVATELPLQILSKLFDNEDIAQFEVPIIRILHFLYSENENFYPIEKRERIVAYDEIEGADIHVNHFIGPVSPWDSMSAVLKKLLGKLSNAGPINPDNYAANQVLYQLLQLTKETLNLGFWLEKEDLNNIYTYILNILQKEENVDYEKVVKKNRQNTLMIDCKIQCLSIIEEIINQDLHLCIQVYNKVFSSFKPEEVTTEAVSGDLIEGSHNEPYALEFYQQLEESSKEVELMVQSSIYKMMVELGRYNNPILTSKSLEILYKILAGKHHQMQIFYSQLFVSEADSVQFANFLKDLKNKFFTLEDINTPKMNLQTQSENYFSLYTPLQGAYSEQAQTSIMHDLYIITELMKNENELARVDQIPSLDTSGVYDRLATEHLMNFTDECKSTNLTKQKIVDAANIHNKVITYILNCEEVPEEELARKLLHLCYKFLVGLIENHQEVKHKVAPFLPLMMKHLPLNIGCVDLLKQMYDNNKNMLYNESQIQTLIRTICNQINVEANILYKSKLLDFFRYLIYLNNNCLRNNQISILKIMQDDDYTQILKNPTPAQIHQLVAQYHELNSSMLEGSGSVRCPPDLIYLATYFQIISSLLDRHNDVNIGKLVKRMPFDYLTQCIEACQDCWILKRNIRAVINRMYYFEPGTNVHMNHILNKEIPEIISDLDRFLAIKLQDQGAVARLETIKYENPVRFTYLESSFYLNLEENLFTLFSLLNTKELEVEFNKIFEEQTEPHQLTNNIIRIAERLAEIRRYFKKHNNIHTGSIIKFLQSRIFDCFKKFKLVFFEPGLKNNRLYNKEDRMPEDEKIIWKSIVAKISEGDIKQFYANGVNRYASQLPLAYQLDEKAVEVKVKRDKDDVALNKLLSEIFTRNKRSYKDKDQEISRKMEKIIEALKLSKRVNRSILQSFQQNLFACRKDSEGEKQLLQYIEILIKINEQNPEILSEQLKIFILKIIISLFYKANNPEQPQSQPTEKPNEGEAKQPAKEPEEQAEEAEEAEEQEFKQIDEWDADDWEENSSQIEKLQERLQECGIGAFLSSLIKDNLCNNVQLANCVLLCGISYMLGGNKNTQDNIREELNKDSENKLLINIRKLITQLGGLIRKNIEEEKSASKEEDMVEDFFITYIDNYDFYDKDRKFMTRKNVSEPHYVDEKLYYEECIITYRRAFKFMQLLCENNNIDNKNFIREQPEKSESVDFIEIATKELRNIFQVYCSKVQGVPIFILDFILEVTQIPVKLNQDAVIKSSFFEDICQLFKKLSSKNEMEERGLSEENVDEIFQKCVQIILSNFEGNNASYFMQLDQKLNPEFLNNLLNQKLQKMGIRTRDDFEAKIKQSQQPKLENGKLTAKTVFDDEIVSLLEIIIIFIKLRDVVGDNSRIYTAYEREKSSDEQGKKLLFNMLESCLLNIEINDDQNNKQTVYFPKHPVFNSISAGLKDYVMGEVERGTHREKIISLLGFVDGIRQKIEQSYGFQKCYNISEQSMKSYYLTSSNLSILICMYMALFYNVYVEYGTAEYTASWSIVLIRFILSLVQFYYSIMYGYTWYRLNIWIKPERKSREPKKEGAVDSQLAIEAEAGESEQNSQKEGFISSKWNSLKNKTTEVILDPLIRKYPNLTIIIEGLKQAKEAVSPTNPDDPTVQGSGQFYKIFLYLIVSLVSTFVYPPLLFIHLIDRLCNKEQLANIFQAVGLVAKQLMYVSMMGVAFVIVFSAITFSNYMKNVYGEFENEDEMCAGAINCILALFVSGAIGETMEDFEITRFTYDTIYGIFFGMLFANIIQSFMLDAFGELDQSRTELDNDKKNFCYICNIDRQRLEKQGFKFEDHTTKTHHLWNYIFYIIALELKSETDYTGLEYYISQRYNLPDEEMDVSWIPDGEEVTFEKDKVVEEMINMFEVTKDSIDQGFKKLEAQVESYNDAASSLGADKEE